MASKGVDYIKDVWDSLFNSEKNEQKKADAEKDIEDFISSYDDGKLPDKEELPDAPKYERMEYDAPSDDEIRETAEGELSDFKNQSERGIERESELKREQYETDKVNAESKRDEAATKAGDAYAEAKKNIDADLLKRGLSRSSIAANKKAAVEQSEAEAKNKIYAEYAKKVSELDEKINSLAASREQALNDFNISYAAKLTERINALKNERSQKTMEALKYNNSLTEKEYDAAIDKKMKESDLYSEALNQRIKENQLTERSASDSLAIYNKIRSTLLSINSADARDIVLSNPNIRNSLTSEYYYKLYDEFCR